MTRIDFVFALVALLALYSCNPKPASDNSMFQGMWRLDKFEAYDSLGSRWTLDSTRAGWTGYILYDGKGHMAVHLLPKGYKEFDISGKLDSMTNDQLKDRVRFYRSNFVYFADYNVEGTVIDHKRLSATSPKDWGTTLTRDFDFRGDTLILTAHESIDKRKIRLRWIKL